ncbi:MAG: DUF1820 family protein [Enterobacterales bacterium]|nr:DUF1820 family protein [Enterobacterales bacterium]
MKQQPVFKIVFINQGKTYEIYANRVDQGDLYGFVTVEELLFSHRNSLVVDPSEEKLKAEFEGVKRTQIPMHAIIRIDEVEKQGVAKISDANGKVVTAFPMPSAPVKP